MNISVIIPVYNVDTWIAPCIDSILQQTYTDIEIICVNDGSTDGSARIIDDYAQHHVHVIAIHQENKGPGGARNTAIKAAKGDYIFMMDADDVLHPQALEILLSHLTRHKADMAWCNFKKLDDHNHKELLKKYSDVKHCILHSEDKKFYKRINLSAGAKMYKTSILKHAYFDDKAGPFPEGIYYEDVGFVTCIMHNISCAVKIDESLYLYRNREGSITRSDFSLKKIQDYFENLFFIDTYYSDNASLKDRIYILNKTVSFVFRSICRHIIQQCQSSDLRLSMVALLKAKMHVCKDKQYPVFACHKPKYRILSVLIIYLNPRISLFFLKVLIQKGKKSRV